MVEKVTNKTKRFLPIINIPFRLLFHVPKADGFIDYRNAKEILVIFYAGIGDAIMNLPFLTILKKNCPKARLTLVCSKAESEIVKKTYLVDRIEVVDLAMSKRIRVLMKKRKHVSSVIKRINETQYDVAIEPRGDLRCIYLMHRCNADRKVSYNYTGGESMLTDVVIPPDETTHLIDDQLYLLKWLGIHYSDEETIPVLKLMKKDWEKNLKFLEEHGIQNRLIIGIHPGASWETKRWKYYGDLVKRVGQISDDIYFFVFSSKGEENTANEVYSVIKSDGLRGQIIKESFTDYVRIVGLCNMMICNDSGSAHIAAAYGIPTIVLFGPFEPSYCKPIGKNSVTVFSQNLVCKPCMSKKCITGDNECMNRITVDEVFCAVNATLRCNGRIREDR